MINDTLDLKCPNKAGRQFFRFHTKWDVFGVEPNLLTRLIGGRRQFANLWFCSRVCRRATLDSLRILRILYRLCSTDGTAISISWEGKRGLPPASDATSPGLAWPLTVLCCRHRSFFLLVKASWKRMHKGEVCHPLWLSVTEQLQRQGPRLVLWGGLLPGCSSSQTVCRSWWIPRISGAASMNWAVATQWLPAGFPRVLKKS